jgi:hypothetical protein
MTTYKIQYNISNIWYNLQNKIGDDMEFITLNDAKTVANVYGAYHPEYSDKYFRLVSSNGVTITV